MRRSLCLFNKYWSICLRVNGILNVTQEKDKYEKEKKYQQRQNILTQEKEQLLYFC